MKYLNNRGIEGGVFGYYRYSHIIFTGNAVVMFFNNTASLSGGAISVHILQGVIQESAWLTGGSTMHFNNSQAWQHGGAISPIINSSIAFNKICTVMFTNNTAMQQGGAAYFLDKSTIRFKDRYNVSYNNNAALQQGGAVYFALQLIATLKKSLSLNLRIIKRY